MSLPPLPEHDGTLEDNTCELRAYTTATLLAYGRACREAALDEAVKMCETGAEGTSFDIYYLECAAAIRALKDQKQE